MIGMKKADHKAYRSKPKPVANAQVSKWVWVQSACEDQQIQRSAGMRYLRTKHNKLRSRKQKLPSGRWGVFVDQMEFNKKVAAGRLHSPKHLRFFINCVEAGADPFNTLSGILTHNSASETDAEFYDADLARAAIRLTLESDLNFLLMLTMQRPPDKSFAGEVVRLLQPGTDWRCREDVEQKGFAAFWTACRKAVRKGGGLIEPSYIISPLSVARDLLDGNRPNYLSSLKCAQVPEWAQRSVIPFRRMVNSTTAAALRRMTQLVETNPRLRQHLPVIQKHLSQSAPRHANPAEHAFGDDPVVADSIRAAQAELVTVFRVPRGLARDYCWAVHNRIHYDSRRNLRRLRDKRNGQPRHADMLPVAVVNRIFCLSRAVRAD